MNREEFSQKLVECRESVGCGKLEMCRRSGLLYKQLNIIERANMNYTANNLFKYLHAIQHVIKINIPNKGVYIVSSRQAFKGVFVEMRSNLNLSQDKSSKQAGISRSAITGIESETMNFTIDIFLKGIYGLNCFLTIEPIE